MLIYLEIWVQLLGTGVRFVLPNVLSSKSNIVPRGGGGNRFHLRGDLLKGPLKGGQSTFAAIFRCVPTTFGNDCSLAKNLHSGCLQSDKVEVFQELIYRKTEEASREV